MRRFRRPLCHEHTTSTASYKEALPVNIRMEEDAASATGDSLRGRPDRQHLIHRVVKEWLAQRQKTQ
jgi:hypothetical protein